MDTLVEYLPYLVPVILLQMILLLVALVDLLRRRATRNGPKWMWLLIILFVNIVGPIIYFVLGRNDEEVE